MPVRTYSSGHAAATRLCYRHLREPDILLLDEVIGVGDAAFFEKAYARLAGIARQSRIMVVASHAEKTIRDLCNKVMWLHNGKLMEFGDVDSVFSAYNRDNAKSAAA